MTTEKATHSNGENVKVPTFKSPIEICINDVNYSIEQSVLAAISKYGIKVNKDELVKALTYDRQQYEEGYRNAMKQMPKWIPVTERLPEEDGLYLISHQNGKVFLDKWLGYDGWDTYMSVKAWMPLPEPFKGGDDK